MEENIEYQFLYSLIKALKDEDTAAIYRNINGELFLSIDLDDTIANIPLRHQLFQMVDYDEAIPVHDLFYNLEGEY